jgi:hypothetical protein
MSTTPPPVSAAWGAPPTDPYAGYRGPTARPTETEPKAVVALVLAVLTWTPLVPFIGAIAALVLGRMARRDIARSGGAKGGLGLVRAATVLSVLHLVLVALLLVLVLVLLAVGVALPFVGS